MQYAKVDNGNVIQIGLPETATLQDGRAVSGVNLLDAETLKLEGWLPVVDGAKPEFNPATQNLTGSYTVTENEVTVNYTVADNAPPVEPEPTTDEVLGELIEVLVDKGVIY